MEILAERSEDTLVLRNVKNTLRDHLNNFISAQAAQSDASPSEKLMILLGQDLPPSVLFHTDVLATPSMYRAVGNIFHIGHIAIVETSGNQRLQFKAAQTLYENEPSEWELALAKVKAFDMGGTETAQAVSGGSMDMHGMNNSGASSNRNDRAPSVDIRAAHNVAQRMKDH
jgi:hypothetical protein